MADVEHLVLTRVAGSGKTTTGRILAERLRRPFGEGPSSRARRSRSATATCCVRLAAELSWPSSSPGDARRGPDAAPPGHFLPPGLLPSQYRALEPLTDAEDGFVVAVDAPPEQVADRVLAALQADLTERRPS